MVAGCPKCSARYRVDADRIGPDGAKLRCTKCSAVFLVRAPKAAAPAPAIEEAPVAAVSEPPVEVAPPPPTPEVEIDRKRLVLIADPDDDRGKASAEAVAGWGLQPHLVQDGVEAMLAIQRLLPRAVVLDAALPKMFGFQVCEVVKRNESLCDTVVVLVGAIHHQARYRRDPSELYGADVYIEQPDLPEGLEAILREGGLPMGGGSPQPVAPPAPQPIPEASAPPEPAFEAPAPPEPVFEAPAPPTPEPIVDTAPSPEPVMEAPTPPAPEPMFEAPTPTPIEPEPMLDLTEPSGPAPSFEMPVEDEEMAFVTQPPAAPSIVEEAPSAPVDDDPEKAEERERAERLARIAVSEMLLYQPEKFEQATRDGNLEQVLDLEIQEARALLRQRIREDVRAERDFIMDELNRVAAERSGQG